jgi:aldehyde:ferredoxin oxidoreductase
LINLRQGKGTKINDRIPLRAIGPVYFNEYQARAEHYDSWLREEIGDGDIPIHPEERHQLLLEKRVAAYEQLCDIVYEKKGFTGNGVPKRSTVEQFGLLDVPAQQILDEFGG